VRSLDRLEEAWRVREIHGTCATHPVLCPVRGEPTREHLDIETEHLLLGLLREGKGLTSRIFARSQLEDIRKEIEELAVSRDKVPTSVDMPFSAETIRVLRFAADEADRLRHNYIGTKHILLGIFSEPDSVAATLLAARGIALGAVREEIARLTDAFRDLS
jgi:ATP-dependent Clp protease ATP-binding subunit ClpC